MHKHSILVREIINKIINDTFFGLCCVIFAASALWVFPRNSFLNACSICLALIFGIFFYVVTVIKVSRKPMSRRYARGFWLMVVIILPVIGGLSFYYLRLLQAYLPSPKGQQPQDDTDNILLEASPVS